MALAVTIKRVFSYISPIYLMTSPTEIWHVYYTFSFDSLQYHEIQLLREAGGHIHGVSLE